MIDYGVGQFEFDGLGVVQAGFEPVAEGHEFIDLGLDDSNRNSQLVGEDIGDIFFFSLFRGDRSPHTTMEPCIRMTSRRIQVIRSHPACSMAWVMYKLQISILQSSFFIDFTQNRLIRNEYGLTFAKSGPIIEPGGLFSTENTIVQNYSCPYSWYYGNTHASILLTVTLWKCIESMVNKIVMPTNQAFKLTGII